MTSHLGRLRARTGPEFVADWLIRRRSTFPRSSPCWHRQPTRPQGLCAAPRQADLPAPDSAGATSGFTEADGRPRMSLCS